MSRTSISVTMGATAKDVRYILDNLRGQDRYEFLCVDLDPDLDRESLVAMATRQDAILFSLDGEPVFIWGIERSRQVGVLWGYGTDKTRRIIPAATRFGQRWWLKRAFNQEGIRRIEVRVPLASQRSISWLRKLGMTVESWDIRDYASNGATMVQLAYTTREYVRDYVHVPSAGSSSPGPDARSPEDLG